jgi:hypothetical protein
LLHVLSFFIDKSATYIYIKGTNAKNFTAHNQLKTEKMIKRDTTPSTSYNSFPPNLRKQEKPWFIYTRTRARAHTTLQISLINKQTCKGLTGILLTTSKDEIVFESNSNTPLIKLNG